MATAHDGLAPAAVAPPRAGWRFQAEPPWEVLERLGRQLTACPDAAAQVRVTLRAVRQALGADLVYWHPGRAGGAVEMAGDLPLAAEWCRAFAERQLAAAGDAGSQIYRMPRGGPAGGPAPCSVAMVRVSRSRGAWVVAVSFDPARRFEAADVQLLALARRLLLDQRRRDRARERLAATVGGLVRCLLAALAAKHGSTGTHSERVARMAVRIGRQMGLAPADLGALYLGGLLHDVGKIGVHTGVLQHPGPLTEEEVAHVQAHPVIGDEIVAAVPALAHLCPVVRHHHEHFDGRGYPDNLSGPAIPLPARIVAVADACDAMLSPRPYRKALAPEQVEAVFAQGAGNQWDPDVVADFLACRHELYALRAKGVGDSVLRAAALAVGADDD